MHIRSYQKGIAYVATVANVVSQSLFINLVAIAICMYALVIATCVQKHDIAIICHVATKPTH